MQRSLDTATLNGAAGYYASLFMGNRPPYDRDFVMREFFKFTFKDEFDYLVDATRDQLGKAARADFDKMAAKVFKPRSKKMLADLLETKLAITPAGEHIEGRIGTTKEDRRPARRRPNDRSRDPGEHPLPTALRDRQG
jgi:hypothetical protein